MQNVPRKTSMFHEVLVSFRTDPNLEEPLQPPSGQQAREVPARHATAPEFDVPLHTKRHMTGLLKAIQL